MCACVSSHPLPKSVECDTENMAGIRSCFAHITSTNRRLYQDAHWLVPNLMRWEIKRGVVLLCLLVQRNPRSLTELQCGKQHNIPHRIIALSRYPETDRTTRCWRKPVKWTRSNSFKKKTLRLSISQHCVSLGLCHQLSDWNRIPLVGVYSKISIGALFFKCFFWTDNLTSYRDGAFKTKRHNAFGSIVLFISL